MLFISNALLILAKHTAKLRSEGQCGPNKRKTTCRPKQWQRVEKKT